ncbi:hypothetical protein Ahy_A04g018404 isoform B [Arachis hypogaea]|uniref:Uncharacterized protein n=1 Tax=Arachis hypogaea TaxID=3818 RepID=A0A445DDK6_ARAHY|nr:hypothetical protein Ahy_A04g018404 isoform B [Arachis hypogaea]
MHSVVSVSACPPTPSVVSVSQTLVGFGTSIVAHSISQTLNRRSSLRGSAPVALPSPSLKSSRRRLPLPHSSHLRQPCSTFAVPCALQAKGFEIHQENNEGNGGKSSNDNEGEENSFDINE